MKAGLYEPVAFDTLLSVAEAAARLQKNEVFDPRQWRCEVQGDRFQLTPMVQGIFFTLRAFLPKVSGSLTAHGSGTAVRLAFRPMAWGWAAWVCALLGVLGLIVYAATSASQVVMLVSVLCAAVVLLMCGLSVHNARAAVAEAVKQLLEVET